ncbi:CotY/CotZ family spore coat protein [Bacillus changyiensis]|uniref:CotY/CotZ family spore coat protein n=1 Tax=Bacillus changyiensis TaxID=3004103 RepID=UPI0022E15230|nr:CotY/CotZ family spore coat protein [Bacillus changyiensis]MDA1475887.1 CotY/CotZ family spore coat protein [Bacillus changyiensis]
MANFSVDNCVCEAVENIFELQNAIHDEGCPTSCFNNLLSPTRHFGDTIPFILYPAESKPFVAFGNVGELGAGPCFNTVFFRVEKIKGCCATLRLLIAFDENRHILDFTDEKDKICDVFRLEKTNFCVECDLECFCAIECLNPQLINRSN